MTITDPLEILRAARASLAGGAHFAFLDWTACTCGCIYTAVMGRRGESEYDVPA